MLLTVIDVWYDWQGSVIQAARAETGIHAFKPVASPRESVDEAEELLKTLDRLEREEEYAKRGAGVLDANPAAQRASLWDTATSSLAAIGGVVGTHGTALAGAVGAEGAVEGLAGIPASLGGIAKFWAGAADRKTGEEEDGALVGWDGWEEGMTPGGKACCVHLAMPVSS